MSYTVKTTRKHVNTMMEAILLVVVVMIIVMTLFEIVKQFYFTGINPWITYLVTVFTS